MQDTSTTNFSSWSNSTKIVVGIGLAIAALMIVMLYMPQWR
jgi:hypothetical protein